MKKKDDYLAIKVVDNGFLISLNEYAREKRSGTWIAKDEQELLQRIATIFPVQPSEEPTKRIRGKDPEGPITRD